MLWKDVVRKDVNVYDGVVVEIDANNQFTISVEQSVEGYICYILNEKGNFEIESVSNVTNYDKSAKKFNIASEKQRVTFSLGVYVEFKQCFVLKFAARTMRAIQPYHFLDSSFILPGQKNLKFVYYFKRKNGCNIEVHIVNPYDININGQKGDFRWKANCEGLYNSKNSSQLVLCLTFELQTPNSVPAANNSTDNSPINKPVTLENNVKSSLLYEIMSDKTYADVVLFSSTGKEILTYRCILAKFSKFFKTIFDETKELPVQHKIKEFDTETIIAALNFCYGKNDVIKNNEKKLFEFAEKYCIKELKESCCAHFADNLSTENVCDIIQIAYSNNFEELKQKCKNLMTEKKAEIHQTKLKALPKDILFDVYF